MNFYSAMFIEVAGWFAAICNTGSVAGLRCMQAERPGAMSSYDR